MSVLGGTSKVFSARFFDSLGQLSVGESVAFMNGARFSGDTATFNYVIDGKDGTLPLVRQPF